MCICRLRRSAWRRSWRAVGKRGSVGDGAYSSFSFSPYRIIREVPLSGIHIYVYPRDPHYVFHFCDVHANMPGEYSTSRKVRYRRSRPLWLSHLFCALTSVLQREVMVIRMNMHRWLETVLGGCLKSKLIPWIYGVESRGVSSSHRDSEGDDVALTVPTALVMAAFR